MKSASSALIALLNGSPALAFADLFTITLSGGTVIRYTSGEAPVTVGGVTWSAGPLITRTGIHWKTGVEVDTLKITIEDNGSNLVSGTPIIAFICAGGLDGARIKIDRAFGSSYGAWTGTVFLFSGLVSEIQAARLSADIQVKSELVLLDAQVPRNLFQARCLNVVFDGTCGLLVAGFTSAGTVATTTGANPTAFAASFGVAPAQVLDQGYVTFNPGPNAGQRRAIKS